MAAFAQFGREEFSESGLSGAGQAGKPQRKTLIHARFNAPWLNRLLGEQVKSLNPAKVLNRAERDKGDEEAERKV
jgi:hypothetical protein